MSTTTNIEWTDVPGHPGYAVTLDGEIRGPRAILNPMAASSGHLYVITGAGKKLWVHHAVLTAFVCPRPDGLECRHIDGDPTNNRVENLCWGTRLQNMRDRDRHGTVRRGEAKPGARLTQEQVEAIRLDTRSARTVGAEYGVSHTAVLRIRRGERWRAA